MSISDTLLEQIIEGALMASGQTLTVERIQSLFEEADMPEKQQIELAIERLADRCAYRGYELKKVATGYRYQVKQDVAKWVSRLWDEKPQRYSRALLETLSIIAYRQPVTRGEIEDIRGVAVSSHLTKTLQEREWIQVVGHRDVPGRPAMYATTKMFLDYFNLESLDQLPTLEEIQEIADANHALEFEDKAEEGNYNLTAEADERDGEDALASAAEDMAAAEAIVAQVESNVFRKPEDDDESEEENTEVSAEQTQEKSLSDLDLPAESELTPPDEELAEVEKAALKALANESEDFEEAQDNEFLKEQQQQEVIARMLAQQQALLDAKDGEPASVESSEADCLVTVDTDAEETAHVDSVHSEIYTSDESESHADTESEIDGLTTDEVEIDDAELLAAIEDEALNQAIEDELKADESAEKTEIAQPDQNYSEERSEEQSNDSQPEQHQTVTDYIAGPSIFDDEAGLEAELESELIAAQEEEAIALLEAEQEELMALQEAEREHAEKSISDLADKLNRTQTTESVDE